MFSYYGSKSKIVKLYDKPIFGKIIEPFAGSARYSLQYPENEVELYDAYPVIVGIWEYLIQASEKDILSLPEITVNFCLDEHKELLQAEKDLLGFLIADGQAKPSTSVRRKWLSLRPGKIRHRIKNLCAILPKIRHWKVFRSDYRDIQNQKCTWFIDPPYYQGGHCYPVSNKNLDYISLSEWCRSRQGQVIVCENSNASWMPFEPIARMKGANKISTECVWTNYSDAQPKLF